MIDNPKPSTHYVNNLVHDIDGLESALQSEGISNEFGEDIARIKGEISRMATKLFTIIRLKEDA